MAEHEVRLQVGNGRFKSLNSILRQLNRQLDRVYQKGLNNNQTVSDKDITNLQTHMHDYGQAINNRQQQLSQQLDQARADVDQEAINNLVDQLEQLGEADQSLGRLFSSDKFENIGNYRVSSSSAFKTNRYTAYNRKLGNDIDELRHEIGRYSNRSKMVARRWEQAKENHVISGDTYHRYQDIQATLNKRNPSLSSQAKLLTREVQEQLSGLSEQRTNVQEKINSGSFTQSDIDQRRAYDEQIEQLKRYGQKLSDLNTNLKTTNERISEIDNELAHPSIKVTGGMSKWWQQHERGFYRGLGVSLLGTLGVTYSRGNSSILGSFDNLKSVAYSRGGNDRSVQNDLMSVGYSLGYNMKDTAQYLNAYTASTGRSDLNSKQLKQVVRAWAGLSLFTGAKDSTTRQLESTIGSLTNGMNSRDFTQVAGYIQNELNHSHMNAKADQQESALSTMLRIASGDGQALSKRDIRNIAGFQGVLASTGRSDLQGQAGAQAYQGLVSAFSPFNTTSFAIFNGGNPTVYASERNYADTIFNMQDAKKDPSKYQPAIRNLLANARTQTKGRENQRRMAAANLVELAKQNGGNLTPDQAYQLVKLEQENKLSKKNINKQTRGNGKSDNEKNYFKTAMRKVRQFFAARDNSRVKATRALNHLATKLRVINQLIPAMPILTSMATSAMGAVGSDLIGALGTKYGGKVLKGAGKVLSKTKDGKGVGRVLESATGLFTGGETAKGAEEATKTAEKTAQTTNNASKVLKSEDGTAKTSHKASSRRSKRSKARRGKTIRNHTKRAENHSKTKSRGKHLAETGLAVGTGLGALSSDNDNQAHASTRKRSRQGNTKTIKQLQTEVASNRKLLHEQEWKLIRHLNTFWDVFLRKVKESGSDSDDGGDISGLSGKGDKAIREIAKAVAKKDNLDAKLVYAQLALESADGTSQEAQKDNNFSGIKGSGGGEATDDGGTYQHFNSISEFANRYAEVLRNFPLHKGMTAQEYASALKHGKYGAYYTADEGSYAQQLQTWADKYALGGLKYHATGGVQNGDANPTINQLNIKATNDIRDLFSTVQVGKSNYIKVEKRPAKINVKIDTSQAKQIKKQDVVDTVIMNVFNEWLNNKQAQRLQQYYANETTGQFV